jgi:predicted RNA binding protein YcfA (HicA-like mRNA interferase family)
MKLPRNLSGENLIKHLCSYWQYAKVHQAGSYVILQTEDPTHHRIAVPAHTPLRVGTLNAILSAIATHKGVTKDEVLKGI